MPSPYLGLDESKCESKTRELIRNHPLKANEIAEVVLLVWNGIFDSAISRYKIGTDIFPKPQVMGFFLHELIALEFRTRYPKIWRGEQTATDKDLVYIPNPAFSVEIKTSSHKSQIFGNRSYAQEETDPKKTKSGYYIAVNFQAFNGSTRPRIVRVRFGWLDHTDWIGQKSATGQQARLNATSERTKLLTLYENGSSFDPGEDLFDLTEEG